MYGFRRGSGGAGGAGNVSTLSGGANGRITLWNGPTTVTGDASGTWSGTGHQFVVGSPTFNASDGHFTGPAGASFGPSAGGGGFTNQPAGDTIDLVSDDAGDTTQQVTIIGTLAGVDASENIMLNGIVPVTSAGTYDLILALVLNGACVGTVTASETSGGLAITTIAPAALSAGLQTFASIDGYGKELQIVASGATTKTVGIGGYALGGGIQREPVVLTGTTKVNTTFVWEGAVQFYLGDLEVTRTVTLNSIAGFDFSPGLISLGTEQDTFISRASAGLLLVEDGSGNARDVQARTGTFGTSVVTPVVSGGAGDIATDGTTFNFFKVGGVTRGYFDSTYFYLSSTGMVADGRILTGTGTVSPYLVSGPGKVGTNVAGTNNTIQAEPGTGSATGSSIVFQTPTTGASGTTGQTQTTRLTINETAATFGGGIVAGGSAFQVSSLGFVNGSGFTIYGSIGGATGKINIASDGVFSSNGDVGISRAAAATFVVGNGTAGDATGTLKAATLVSTGTVRLQGYTVATLPAGTVGDTAYVTDATAPTYNAALTGGGAVTIPVFYNGAAWVSH